MTSAKVRTAKKFSAWWVPATLAAIKTLVRQGGVSCTARFSSVVAILLCGALASSTVFADPLGFLETVHRHTTLMNTVPDNGDQNPYAIAIAPVSAGAIKKGDVLVDNFNNAANLQGTGSTIVDYHPDTKQMTLFAFVPRALKDCPGGIGLSTAMTILKSGWVVVGSTPSNDGTTDTKGAGCLVVLDTQGKVVSTFTSPNINDPWGNMAVIDNSSIGIRRSAAFQESVVGREKYSGAPLGKKNEFGAPDLDAADKDGNPMIPENAHVRLSNRATNNGARILRRSYSYNDGTNFYIERWPPWRQETEYDSGLIFIAHQRDPRTGFIPINEKLAKFDMMNQFTTHVGSAIFACPPGVPGGSFIGAALFDV